MMANTPLFDHLQCAQTVTGSMFEESQLNELHDRTCAAAQESKKTKWTYPLYVALNQKDLAKTKNLDKAHMSSPQHIAFWSGSQAAG